MTLSSRALAKTWPYQRHIRYERKLRTAAANWFAEKGLSVSPKRGYILARWEDWPKNIILPEVASYISEERTNRQQLGLGFPLHRYIHHGLSSQAMVFNLVGPLIVRNDLSILRNVVERQGINWPEGEVTASFEYEDREIFNEDSGQPTSIDLIIKNDFDAPLIFIEAKFVEREFGGCSVFASGDCDGRNPSQDFSLCYLHHIDRKYWTVLEEHGFLTQQMKNESICPLTVYYQFFREVLFALEHGGSLILLADDRNPTFSVIGPHGKRGLMPFLLSFVPDTLKSRVRGVSIQSLVNEIKASGRHEWIGEFEKKYGFT